MDGSRTERDVERLEQQIAALRRQLAEATSQADNQTPMLAVNEVREALDASTIVAITDGRGVITYVNDKFVEISGYNRDELIGQTHRVINSGYHSRSFFQNMWRTISRGEIWQDEIRNQCKSGSYYWVHTTIVPFLKDGVPRQYVAIRSDITDRKRTEAKLRETQEQLMIQTLFAQRLSALAALAGGIAHELNQPLSGIRVYAETVRSLLDRGQTMDPEAISTIIGKIVSQVDRAAGVIEHMREFASEQTDDATTSVDLHEVVDRVMELIGEQLRAHGIVFDNQVPMQTIVRANRNRLEQVLINLISNSKDSIDEKPGRGGSIGARIERRDGSLILALSDTGTGIPKDVRQNLFEPFVTTKGPDRGTGLGLAICHGILRDYGGRIYLARSDDDGAVFHLEFPAVAAAEEGET